MFSHITITLVITDSYIYVFIYRIGKCFVFHKYQFLQSKIYAKEKRSFTL